MAETKSQGAKAMFDQSLLYLLNAYRADGMTKEQAQEQVGKDIAEIEQKSVEAKILPQRKKANSLIDPIDLVSDIEKTVDILKNRDSITYRAIMQKLARLKSNLKQGG